MNGIARINKMVMASVFIAEGAVLSGYIIKLIAGDAYTLGGIAFFFALPVIFNALALRLYFRDKDSTAVRNWCVTSLFTFLAVALHFGDIPAVYVVGFPVIIVFGFYNDYKFVLRCVVILLIINATAIAADVMAPGYVLDLGALMIRLVPHMLLAVTLPGGVKLLSRHHEESAGRELKRTDEINSLMGESARSAQLIGSLLESTGETAGLLSQYAE